MLKVENVERRLTDSYVIHTKDAKGNSHSMSAELVYSEENKEWAAKVNTNGTWSVEEAKALVKVLEAANKRGRA